MKITLKEIKAKTGIGFGTSGVRAKVEELTDKVCYSYSKGFLQYLFNEGLIEKGESVAIAGDYRKSTPRIMEAVARAVKDMELSVVNCAFVPSPAISYYGNKKVMASIMVTGSHIPDDRNGIKYNLKDREILKSDEAGITGAEIELDENLFDGEGYFISKERVLPEAISEAREIYKERYLNFFPEGFLRGRKIGLYQHSAVGREVIAEILESLGAEVVSIDKSEVFVPVDTEVISEELRDKGRGWSKEYGLDCIISTDGDSDRPLLADEKGEWLRADTLGIWVGKYLGIEGMVAPVSCNTALEKSNFFKKVVRTKIGSPYVLEAMMEMEKEALIVGGYEANGGFLLQSKIVKEGKELEALKTRDALIVPLAIIGLAKREGKSIEELAEELPKRFTQSDSVKGFPTEKALEIISRLSEGSFEEQKKKIEEITMMKFGEVIGINTIDGLRVTFEGDRVVHFRPSMNAPEFRNYVEAESVEEAAKLASMSNEMIRSWM